MAAVATRLALLVRVRSNIYHCYMDLWKSAQGIENAQYQGIDSSDKQNVTQLCFCAKNSIIKNNTDITIPSTYGNRFYLSCWITICHMPFYQLALWGRLGYELTFCDYSHIIQASGDTQVSYTIENSSVLNDMAT